MISLSSCSIESQGKVNVVLSPQSLVSCDWEGKDNNHMSNNNNNNNHNNNNNDNDDRQY